MNKRDLVSEIADRRRTSRASAAVVVDEFLAAISRALSEGRDVQLRRFGHFVLRARRARTMRNPRSGHEINVPAKLVPVFRSSKQLEQALNHGEPEL